MGKLDGVTTLDLDKKRKYQLNLNAMINFEEETGKSLINMSEGDELTIPELRALIWVGLNEFEDIALEEVGKLIHPGNMAQIEAKIMEVYGETMPEQEKNTGEAEGKNKNRSAG